MTKLLKYSLEDLRKYVVTFFTRFNVPESDSAIAADVLLAADLRGVDSHGIIRLHTYYGDRLRKRQIDPSSPVSIVHETPTSLLLDGGNGLGQVIGHGAMKRCIEKARTSGMAMVTVRNSNHYGIAGYFAMMALAEDMIGISFTNSQPLVAPTYGKAAILGTNPIAIAVPSGHERPYMLDMATSIVPIGRVSVYDKAGKKIPAGWGIDSSGEVTTDPGSVIKGGALMPLGGIDLMRGYKGYGLAMMVDIFSGILSGAAYGSQVGRPANGQVGSNVGHYFAAIRVDAFRPVDEFKKDMDDYIQMLKNSPKAEGQERIFIAGEKEYERAERYTREGVPLMAEIVRSLEQAGKEVGMDFDLKTVGEVEIDD